MPLTPTALPFFTDPHRAFAERFRPWVAAELTRFERSEGGDGTDARAIFRLLGEAEWLRSAVTPNADSPRGAPDLRLVCLMREALAYSSAMADVAFSEPWLAILPILAHGTEAQRAQHLPRFCTASHLLAFALSEPDAGSDVAAITSTASLHGDGYVVQGQKTWTSNAGLAEGYVVFAKLQGEPGKSALCALLVKGDSPRLSLAQRVPVSSPHTVGTLRFDGCVAAERIGAEGEGFAIAMSALQWFRPTVAAACVGFARRAFDEARERAQERKAFGRSIADHQMIQAKLADMAVKIDAAALLTYRAAWAADTGADDAATSASVAKLYASEVACEVVDEAVQIFGGAGVVEGSTVERLYRHVRAFRIFDGTSEIQRLIIAKALLADGSGG